MVKLDRVDMMSSRWVLLLAIAFWFQVLKPIAYGQNDRAAMMQMRPIGDRSAVERYLPAGSKGRLEVYARNANDLNVGIEKEVSDNGIGQSNSIKQAQFQLPSPGNSTDSSGGFLNSDSGVSGQEAEASLRPFPNAQTSPQLPQVEKLKESIQKQNRQLPEGGNRSLPPAWQSGSENRGYVEFPLPKPGERYATMNNSTFVSPASGYLAEMSWGKNSVEPASFASQTQAPGHQAASELTAILPSSRLVQYEAVPSRPLFTFGQESKRVVVGQGFLGQPVAYVPGQWVRNSIRYLFP